MAVKAADGHLRRNIELRNECSATLRHLESLSEELHDIRASLKRRSDFFRWQEYFDFDPQAAEFFRNLSRADDH